MNLRQLIFISFTIFMNLIPVFSQILEGVVFNEANSPLQSVHLVDTVYNTVTTSDKQGRFIIPIKNNSVLKVSHIGHQTQYLNSTNWENSLSIEITMKSELNKLKEIVVSSDKKEILLYNSESVVDYIPKKDFSILLNSNKTKFKISLNNADKTIATFPINHIKPESFFEDCFGNLHLMTKDSVYEFWLDTTLHFVNQVDINTFNEKLKPCIANFESSTIFEEFTYHQKRYHLTVINKVENRKYPCFQTFDKKAFKIAQRDYQEIIGMYFSSVSEDENIVLNNTWSGNLVALAENKFITPKIGWYLNHSGAKIKVQSFKSKTGLITFDSKNDSIYFFNSLGKQIKQLGFNYPKLKKAEILHDKITDRFYLINQKGGIYSIRFINLNTGNCTLLKTLNGYVFSKNIKIYNNKAYFIKNLEGQNTLHEFQLF